MTKRNGVVAGRQETTAVTLKKKMTFMILAGARNAGPQTVNHDDGLSIILAIQQTGKQKCMLGTNKNMRGITAIELMGRVEH